jgi:hypothetical protein
VIITPSANPVGPFTVLRDLAVPVITTAASNFPNMGLTGNNSGVDFGTATGQNAIEVEIPLHPLGANLAATQTMLSSGSDTFSWGVPVSSAEIVSTLVGVAGKGTTFAYEAGDSMVGLTAPERRLALWLGPSSAQVLTPEGSLLLDAAIAWAFASDGDRDGLGFAEEFRAGTNTADPDSNDDGILDGAAVDSKAPATSADSDGDGLTNVQERVKGTDPFNPNTDGDTVNDAADCFPLDPARQCLTPPPTDVTPPVITLTEPTNASFVSAVCTPPTPCPPP